MLKQNVPVPWETRPPAIPLMVVPSEGLKSLKHSFRPDMVIEQSVSIPILNESVSNLGLKVGNDDWLVDWKA